MNNLVIYLFIILSLGLVGKSSRNHEVVIFHLIDNALWGEVDGSYLQGTFACPAVKKCTVISSDSKNNFFSHLGNKYHQWKDETKPDKDVITVGLYNIHTWKALSHSPYPPDTKRLPTNLNMAESEESSIRFQHLFLRAFPLYDGYSTTHPRSDVPRTYFKGWNLTQLIPLKPIASLIPGAVFVASTCHRGDGNTKRQAFVRELMQYMRVDSLGKCLQTKEIPEGITLGHGRTYEESLRLKQQAISNYYFYLAFENTQEPGYVTEKVFDGLIAGTVPVYLGATEDCRKLIPSQRSVIFTTDYGYDPKRLASYLQYLMKNQTAYEEYRQWRVNFQPSIGSDLVVKSWPCRICEWAVRKQSNK